MYLKNKKLIMSAVIAASFAAVSALSDNTYATNYSLEVGNTTVATDTSGSGFTWNSDTGTLSLSNYNGGAIRFYGGDNYSGNFTVSLDDTNTITGGNLYSDVATTIQGSGSLAITNNSTACINISDTNLILASGTFDLTCNTSAINQSGSNSSIQTTINDGVNLTASTSANSAIVTTGSLNINGGTINLTNNGSSSSVSGLFAMENLTIGGGVIGLSKYGTGITDHNGNITISGGTITNESTKQGIATPNGSITFSGGTTTITGTESGFIALNAKNQININNNLRLSGGVVAAVDGSQHVLTCSGEEANNITIASGVSSTICNGTSSDSASNSTPDSDSNSATAVPNTGGSDITNPNTGDHNWLYGLIALGLTASVFFARRKLF